MKVFIVLSAVIIGCLTQRPYYSGRQPIGYPVIETTTTAHGLGDRFGDDTGPTTTPKLPIEARGDVALLDRLSKLPKEHQPFWFLNWQALEEERKHPHNYPLRPNSFIDNNVVFRNK